MRIGIDLGGTKIELVALDEDGVERFRRRVPTPQGDYRATLQAIAGLVRDAEHAIGCMASVGIGTPGSLSPSTGLIRNANSTCLNGQPLQQDLEALLQRPLRLANDANCLAMSEATDGAGAGAEVVFAVILGTGVGGGLVVRGGLSRVERLYANVPRLWKDAVFSDHVATRLLPAAHGDASGVRGAAWLWPART